MKLNNIASHDNYTVQIILQNGEAKHFFTGPKLEAAIELIKDLINGRYYNIRSANIIVTTTTIMNAYSKEYWKWK